MPATRYQSFNQWLPMPSLMDRYIINEVLPPFLFGVGAFSSVGLAVGTLFELVRKVVDSGLPIAVAVKVFLLNIPQFVVFALPMSTLLATLIAYSRLKSDSELIALRNCGVSIYRLVVPAVICSLLVTAMTFVLNEKVVPAANYQASFILNQALKQDKPSFREENIFYPEYQQVQQPDGHKETILTRLFYADQFDGERMRGLTIIDYSKPGLNQIVVAESALWNPTQSTWDFFDGTSYVVAPDKSYRNILRFEQQQIQLPPTPLNLIQKNQDSTQMSIAEASQQLKAARLKGSHKQVQKLMVRIQEKIAFPFVCIVFGLVGATLGNRSKRASRATSFGISIIIIFCYHSLQFTTSALGTVGTLSPLVSAWLPNIFGFGVSGLLLVRVAR